MKKSTSPPQAIEIKTYTASLAKELDTLYSTQSGNESAFQEFFEKNPGIVPGARAEMDFGPSGHVPERLALITQPKINGVITRHPDFMWLAQDSMTFSPVLIEIEAPSKKYFNRDGTPTSDFTRAKNQLDEWTMVLRKPENVLQFYENYDISLHLRKSIFKPLFVLIYGRRSEYYDNPLLRNKRSSLVDGSSHQYLMSYDRLGAETLDWSFVTCNVKDGKFYAKHVAPTFKLSISSSHLFEIEGIDSAIDTMVHTSEQRKKFLKKRIPYWINKLQKGDATPRTIGLNDLLRQE